MKVFSYQLDRKQAYHSTVKHLEFKMRDEQPGLAGDTGRIGSALKPNLKPTPN